MRVRESARARSGRASIWTISRGSGGCGGRTCLEGGAPHVLTDVAWPSSAPRVLAPFCIYRNVWGQNPPSTPSGPTA